jgi:hypothetical protein
MSLATGSAFFAWGCVLAHVQDLLPDLLARHQAPRQSSFMWSPQVCGLTPNFSAMNSAPRQSPSNLSRTEPGNLYVQQTECTHDS